MFQFTIFSICNAILNGKRNAYFTFWYYIDMKWRCELNIIFILSYWVLARGSWIENHSTMKREIWIKHDILAKNLSRRYRYTCYNLKFLLIIFLIFDVYVQMFRTLFVLTSERYRGETIRFLLRGENQIIGTERFHVSQSHAGYSNTIDRVGYNGPGQKFKKLL
jgi:hypothetical protein